MSKRETKINLIMIPLTEFYKNIEYITEIKKIIEEDSIVSLRILDWFITNYAKKYRTITSENGKDVYQNYKLQLKSFSKSLFDPFSRKNKIVFYYTETNSIETSCGQLCFFKWCFENNILDYVKKNMINYNNINNDNFSYLIEIYKKIIISNNNIDRTYTDDKSIKKINEIILNEITNESNSIPNKLIIDKLNNNFNN